MSQEIRWEDFMPWCRMLDLGCRHPKNQEKPCCNHVVCPVWKEWERRPDEAWTRKDVMKLLSSMD